MSVVVGNPQNALIFFGLYSGIGIVLGGVIYALFAWPGARRPQFRHLRAMPRSGATVAICVTALILYMAWNSMYRDFYRLDFNGEVIRLQYYMPSQIVEVPRAELSTIKKRFSSGRGGNRQILLVTERGTFSSAKMYSRQFDEAWEALTPHFPME